MLVLFSLGSIRAGTGSRNVAADSGDDGASAVNEDASVLTSDVSGSGDPVARA